MAGLPQIGIQHTCLSPGPGAELRITLRKTGSLGTEPVTLSVSVTNSQGEQVFADFFAGTSTTFRFSPAPDDTYTVTGTDESGNIVERTYTIACGAPTGGGGTAEPGTCDLAITAVQVLPSSVRPSVEFTLTTTASWVKAVLLAADGTELSSFPAGTPPGVPLLFLLVPYGTHTLIVEDARGCRVEQPVQVTAPAPEPEPEPEPLPAPAYYAVGGRVPRPALLATPVSALLTDGSQPRPGLHVELELSRPEAAAPFARLRKTVRRQRELVDVAQALHAELVPEMLYPTGRLARYDGQATLPFTYRWREVDATGAGEWQQARGAYYALLSAVPGELPATTYVADAGRPAPALSVFPSGQLVQPVGLPLELAVWLPERQATWYAELRYLDGYGAELEIRSVPLPGTLPAGVCRLSLPPDPLLCATQLVLTLTDTDRSYPGSCPVATTPPPPAGIHDFLISDLTDTDFK